jgi:hypothetical protein
LKIYEPTPCQFLSKKDKTKNKLRTFLNRCVVQHSPS